MATKTNEWNTWKTLPNDGDLVIVKIDKTGHHGQYFDDGNVQFDDFVLLPADRGKSVWKPKETKPDETEPEVFRDSEFKMIEKEYNQMISEWMKNNRGTVVTDLSTNIPPRNLGEKKVPVLVLSFNSGLVTS